MKRCIALTLFAVSSMAVIAWSQCKNPSSPGVVICTPTNGSTVVYIPEISIRSTPAQGGSITLFRLYDNNVDFLMACQARAARISMTANLRRLSPFRGECLGQ